MNIIENQKIRVVLDIKDEFTSQKIEIKDRNEYIPIIGSSEKLGPLLFIFKNSIYSKPLMLKNKSENNLILNYKDSILSILLEITIENDDLIHFKYTIKFNHKLKLTKLISNYDILLGNNPDYTWVPHIRPKENYVMADHIFRSPAVIYNKGKYSFSLIPDLDILAKNRPFQTILDLNLKTKEYTDFPQLSFGFGNYKSVEHILFRHNPKKHMKIKADSNLIFGYYVKLFNDLPINDVLAYINSFLWERYGKKRLYADCNPQVLSYDTFVEEGFKAIFKRHNYWGNFQIDNIECGGVFLRSWMGSKKKALKYIKPEKLEKYKKTSSIELSGQTKLINRIISRFSNSPFWIKRFDKFTRHHAIITRNAEMRNNAWFLNVRTGYGFRYFAKLWNDQFLKDKGNRTLNTVLNLPRIKGVFPSVILPEKENAIRFSTINGLKAFIFTDDFHLVDICLAIYWAIKFFEDFGEVNGIKEKCKELFDLIEELQLDNGAIPTYIGFKDDNKTPIIRDTLLNSASTGAPLMFLTEYYKISKDKRIIPIAEKCAKYIQTEIIPQDKWHDYEPFFSCTHLPFDIYDNFTKSHVMNTLSIYWSAEGLKELYKITKNKDYLILGERVLSILSLFQQVWDMPYISYNTFGGFGVQNADAELSDARQGLFVRTYMEYYLETGKKEYMERGIATLRSCFALMLLRELKEQCPGNLIGIETLDGVDRGCICENYGHSGHDLRIPGYIMFDWGIGTSASATAYTKKHFGDLFIDFKENIAWGIDGLIVRTFEYKDDKIFIKCDKIADKKYILVKARDPPKEELEIFINDTSLGSRSRKDLEEGFIFDKI